MIRYIIILVVAILVLSYFGFSIKDLVQNPNTQSNFAYVWHGVVYVWYGYLAKPANYLWNEIFLKIIWRPAIENFLRMNANQPTTIDEIASSTLRVRPPQAIPM